jgi:hypothetical protein
MRPLLFGILAVLVLALIEPLWLTHYQRAQVSTVDMRLDVAVDHFRASPPGFLPVAQLLPRQHITNHHDHHNHATRVAMCLLMVVDVRALTLAPVLLACLV